jgi:DNA repair protein RadA/Sms
LKEAAKLGFTRAIIPVANQPKHKIAGMEVCTANRLDEALLQLF